MVDNTPFILYLFYVLTACTLTKPILNLFILITLLNRIIASYSPITIYYSIYVLECLYYYTSSRYFNLFYTFPVSISSVLVC